MAYLTGNPKSKAEVRRGIKAGKRYHVYQPSLGPDAPYNGSISVEGPHAPKPHTFYGVVRIENGVVVSIL